MNVGILGIGKLGLCFALNLEQAGHAVIGVDVNEEYVSALSNKTFSSSEAGVNDLLAASKNFKATTKTTEVLNGNFPLLFVMVATPSLPDGSYNHSQIEHVVGELIALGKRDERVDLVIGCTVMPGYCDELQQRLAPYNYAVSYNPEFIAQGSILRDQLNPDQVLIGEADTHAGDLLQQLFQQLCHNKPTFCRMNRLSAEICKLATNCFLTTKISFANSIGDLAIKAGADADKILAAIGSDSRIGNKYLGHGFGFGGPCFPRDNRALNLFAHNMGFNLVISQATDQVNLHHLDFQFEQYMNTYKANEPILFDGITYKRGSEILEESQPLKLALKLAAAGRSVVIRDSSRVIEQLRKEHGNIFTYQLTD